MPSIDVPLLRSERSAWRSKRLWRWGLGAALGIAAAVGLALAFPYRAVPSEQRAEDPTTSDPGSDIAALTATPPDPAFEASESGTDQANSEEDPSADPSEAPATATTATAPATSVRSADGQLLERTSHTFGKALSFRDALEHAGLSRDESTELIAGLSGVIDFRRSHPEDTFTLARSESGALERFEYRASLTQRYEATRDSSGKWQARQLDIPLRVRRVAKSGVVVGSLGDTLEALKLGRSLAGVFSEVFEGQVSFSTDTRAGDEFRIIFDEEYVDDTFLRHGAVHAVEYKGEKTGKLRAFWYEVQGDGDFYDEHGRALHGGWLRTPLRYDHVSSGFGMRFHPVLKRKQLHNGIDYAASSGTPVHAAAAGTVTFAGPKGANGNLVVIAHAQGFESFYAHLSRFATGLKSGARVKQRQVIAYVGSTGRSTGPHLHFSLKKSGKFLDPASQLNGPGLPMSAATLPDYKRRVRELNAALEKLTPERPLIVAPSSQPASPGSTGADLGEEEL
jgi:murein DD-endopeptidase MepM/ murein hydrolase activator NlpD